MSFEKPTLFCVSCFSDHHLTTSRFRSASQPEFYVSTFFCSRKHQRRNLCNLHNFLRGFIVFSRITQFSDQTIIPQPSPPLKRLGQLHSVRQYIQRWFACFRLFDAILNHLRSMNSILHRSSIIFPIHI